MPEITTPRRVTRGSISMMEIEKQPKFQNDPITLNLNDELERADSSKRKEGSKPIADETKTEKRRKVKDFVSGRSGKYVVNEEHEEGREEEIEDGGIEQANNIKRKKEKNILDKRRKVKNVAFSSNVEKVIQEDLDEEIEGIKFCVLDRPIEPPCMQIYVNHNIVTDLKGKLTLTQFNRFKDTCFGVYTQQMLSKRLFHIQLRKSSWTNSNVTQSSLTILSCTKK